MKLYWRVKIDGKWTYKAADIKYITNDFTKDEHTYVIRGFRK
tara:strand:+ start:300 stop:425 length:126 start_codon:yes stop_codon:yes gene_type:complete